MFLRSIRKVCFQDNIFRALHCHRGSEQVSLGFKWSLSQRIPHKCILNSSRYCSTSSSAYEVKYENLSNRGLVRLSGEGVHQFLQGVMTNDINHLQNSTSLYTMFLNTKGRILYDSIIYKYNDILLVECDINDIDNFIKHLKMYRVRRKIDIDNMTDVLNAGVLFDPSQNPSKNCDLNGSIKDLEQLVPCSTIYEHDSSFELYVKDLLVAKNNIFIYRDPRLSSLGVRLVHPKDLDINSILEKQNIVQTSDVDNYTTVRYKLGVAEGIEEIPIGNSFPHEYNCDYLHGVSFHKGCYIGQELTARTQHTGVVRKRIMPLYFEDTVNPQGLTRDSVLEDFDHLVKINIGKVRGVHGKYGLGLMRIAEALKVNQLKVKNNVAKTTKPAWWPIEASKNINKAREQS